QKVEHSLDPVISIGVGILMLDGGVFLVEESGLMVPFIGLITIGSLVGIAQFQDGALFSLIGIVPLAPELGVHGPPSPTLSKGHHGIVTDPKEKGHPVVVLLSRAPIGGGIAKGEHGFKVPAAKGGGMSVLSHPGKPFCRCPGKDRGPRTD